MRFGYDENGGGFSQAELDAEAAGFARSAEEIFAILMANQKENIEGALNAFYKELNFMGLSEVSPEILTKKFAHWSADKAVFRRLQEPFISAVTYMTPETAEKVAEMIRQFENANNFGIQVAVSWNTNCSRRHNCEVRIEEASFNLDQLVQMAKNHLGL